MDLGRTALLGREVSLKGHGQTTGWAKYFRRSVRFCLRRSGRWLNRIRDRLAKQLLQGSQLAADRSAKEAVIADLDKSMRENMLKETLKELLERKRALFELTGVRSAILKGDQGSFQAAAILESQQTAIADGNAMDIGSQVLERSLTIANRFAMNDPLLRPNFGRELVKEFQFLQTAAEGSSKQFGQGAHRQEEALACRQPGLAIRVQATAWGEIMHMRMKDQIAGPGVQDTHQTDLSADITRVKSELLGSLGRSLKEKGVESLLI
jgi:hypothetical protein